MKQEPLKGKVKSKITTDSDLHPELVFDKEDIASAVEWLKKQTKKWLNKSQGDLSIELIDQAFEDIIKK